MLIKEYRVVMPLSMEEYHSAQLYSCAMASQAETGGGEGVEIVRNEYFENVPFMGGKYHSGQYTQKIYHLDSRIPRFIRMLTPTGSLEVVEEAWNAYPYCKTVITNPGYMKESFSIIIESLHLPDKGDQHNVLELSPQKLALRDVVMVDIVNDSIPHCDYCENEDPSQFHSKLTGRGPLTSDWITNANPVMTCYKVVTAEFKWFGMQSRVENLIQGAERRLLTRFHRQIFCWIDQWSELTLEEIRIIEERIREELNQARRTGLIRGMQIENSN